ncbi:MULTISPECIES: ABC transporter substrate-binding protein [unclassified Polaromonas]|uniref:ABC transporter substrate-binding protein n=1 Tax=unclassified Polaromonas TaxID=2638319 RepID=UPI0018C93AA7|nr:MULTISPECIES: ABC transporter substrate-binding protein [unclassified Polaromonas]MBG6070793.1 ABC-type branched-subunit amino acid transport system substrate-binding protein [Polaromonas sp. CG_9.7]MBG6112898.1 ABC-type branched-subunit amino acid transport system substrate-binding protein [Polaromonas sp. CG_9.2]MDH6186371.1 ABC-type branched-subunit amino acid transport system substrate-binding protein [Polaromonas sp. CG_23.6]
MLTRRKFSIGTGAVLVAGVNSARAQSNGKIILGQSAAFTGPAAQLGIQFNQGAQVYFDQVNAQGGVGRQQIELRKLDDGYEPARCVENTKKFIADDVFALFGYIGTPTSLMALPIAIKEKIPFVAPFTGAMGLREPFSRYAFHVRASYNDETELIVKQLTTLGLKKIAVFYQNDAYGKAGLEGVHLALGRLSLKPVAQATVERNSVDVGQAVKTLVAAQPDAVVQIGAYKACAAFIREARKAGYGGTFYNVSFVGTQALADDLGKDGAGVVVSQVVPSPYNPARPIAREFADAVKAVGSKEVQANFSSMEGYLAAKVFVDGLKRAGGKPTRESLITGLENIGSQSFGGFSVSFGPGNHVASRFVELSMLTGDGRVRT